MSQAAVDAPRTGLAASSCRIGAMMRRYFYLLRASWPRILDIVYWPLVFMLVWGFLQLHLGTVSSFYAAAPGLLIGAVLLWDMLLRSQLHFSFSFLEEMWSRNLGHLFMSPLTVNEFVAALMLMSLVRLLVGLFPVVIVAKYAFGFDIFTLGWSLPLFFANLVVTGWALGLASAGTVLRFGLGAEGFVWSAVFVLLPIVCVYYPVSILPGWLQVIALAMPPTHVFEGMRAVLLEHVVRADFLLYASLLNALWLAAGFALFHYLLRSARRHGSLLQMGE